MAVYTPLTRTDLIEALQLYAIPELEAYTPVERGNSNTSYVLKTREGQFVLTVFEAKSAAQVLDLARLMEWLKNHDFSSSIVRPTAKGALVARFRGKPILLKEWVPGDFIRELRAEHLVQIGRALARLHGIPVPDFVPTGYPFGVATFSKVIGQGLDIAYERWLQERLLTLPPQLPAALPKGLIHADLFFDNVLFADGRLQAIIDVEEACYDYCIFDIGMTVVGCCRSNGVVDLTKVSALVRGYERVRRLTPRERASLQLFIDYAATAMSRWRYWKYYFAAPNPIAQGRQWEMVEVAEAVRRIGRTAFLDRVFPAGRR